MEQLITNVQTTANNNIILVQWDSDPSPCKQSDIDYIVEYQLINLDQCSQATEDLFQPTVSTSASSNISNLDYHSTYTMQVTARRNGVEIPSTTVTARATTQEAGKNCYNDWNILRVLL